MNETDWNKITSKYTQAIESKKALDNIIHHAFINVSEHIKFQMGQLTQLVEELDVTKWTEEELQSMSNCLKTIFSRDASIFRSSLFFSLFFASYQVDVTWLDEIAEALKHTTSAVNNAILSIASICKSGSGEANEGSFQGESSSIVTYMRRCLRHLTYTIGWVAGRLIQRQ